MTSTSDQILSLLSDSNARANAATEGPWTGYVTDEFPPGWIGIRADVPDAETLTETHIATLGRFNDPHTEPNRAFIAAARTELPARNEAIRVLVKGLAKFVDEKSWKLNGPCDPNSGHFEGSTMAEECLTRALAILIERSPTVGV